MSNRKVSRKQSEAADAAFEAWLDRITSNAAVQAVAKAAASCAAIAILCAVCSIIQPAQGQQPQHPAQASYDKEQRQPKHKATAKAKKQQGPATRAWLACLADPPAGSFCIDEEAAAFYEQQAAQK